MILDDEKEIKNEQEEQEITPEETSSTEETTPVVEAAAETVEEVAEEAAPVVEAAVETVEEVAEEAAPVVEIAAEAAAPVQPVSKEAMAADEEEEEEVELPIFDPLLGDGLHDDFNWKMDKRGAIAYSDAERHQLLKQYENTLSNVTENEIIKGRVSAISAGDVVLDINYKSDGLVPMSEFRDMPDLKQGDEVEVYVESQEDSQGQLGLSRKKAKILRAWESIVDSFKNGTIIRGTVISKTKGGLIVDCGGLETFLPGSQIDIKPVIDYDQYVGKVM